MIRARHRLQLSVSEVYSLSILFALFVLLGGRFVEVVFYEWPFYSEHPELIFAYWLGGMSTHYLPELEFLNEITSTTNHFPITPTGTGKTRKPVPNPGS